MYHSRRMKAYGPYHRLQFVHTASFESTRKGVLSDEDVHRVEVALLENPEAGAVLAGTGGVRKLRAAIGERGKRGSARVAYLYVRIRERVYFLMVLEKNVQGNFSAEQKKALRQLAEQLRKEAG